MDIINIQKADYEKQKAENAQRAERQSHQPKISEEKAAKIWAIMAEPDQPKTHVAQPYTLNECERPVISSSFDEQRVTSDERRNEDILAGAAVCGISPALLAVAFPEGIPADYLEALRQVVKSPGSNRDRELGLKNSIESQATIQRRNRLIRTY